MRYFVIIFTMCVLSFSVEVRAEFKGECTQPNGKFKNCKVSVSDGNLLIHIKYQPDIIVAARSVIGLRSLKLEVANKQNMTPQIIYSHESQVIAIPVDITASSTDTFLGVSFYGSNQQNSSIVIKMPQEKAEVFKFQLETLTGKKFQ